MKFLLLVCFYCLNADTACVNLSLLQRAQVKLFKLCTIISFCLSLLYNDVYIIITLENIFGEFVNKTSNLTCYISHIFRKIFNDLSGSESPTKVETIPEDIQAPSDGTDGTSPIAVITTSTLNYQQAPQTVTIPGTIQIVTSGDALQTVPMAQNSSATVVQYQQPQQVTFNLLP